METKWNFRNIFLLIFTICINKTENAKWNARASTYTVEHGKTALMECTTVDKFIGFYKPNGELISTTSRYKVYGDSQKVLEIENLNESDYGYYNCSDSTGIDTVLLEIEVTIPPIVSPQIFSTGSDGFVKAAIYGKPRRKKVEWSYIPSLGLKSIVASLDVNDDIVNGNKFVVSTSGLTIKNIEKSDSGEYEVSTSIIGSRISQKVIVDVGDRPTLKSKVPVILSQTEGLDIFIPCEWNEIVKNRTWKFQSASTNLVSTINKGLYNETGLYLQKLSPLDEGNYTCSANNYYGESSVTVFLSKVLIIPRITAETFNNITTLSLKSFIISCTSTGSPPPTVKITKISSKAVLVSGTGSVNYSTPLDVSESGDYLCEAMNGAKNSDGSVIVAKKKMTVDILTPPTIVTNLTTRIAVSAVGLELKFTCAATGNPIPDITLEPVTFHQPPSIIKTKKTVHSMISMTVTNATKEDFFDVKCKAVNMNGVDEYQIQSKEVLKPPPPEGLNMSGLAGLEYIELQWKTVKTADKYIIYVNDTLRQLESLTNGIIVKNLNRSTLYSFKVASQNIAGFGDTSDSVVFKTSSIIKPEESRNFIWEDLSFSSAVVKWSPPNNVLKEKNIITYLVKVCKFNNESKVLKDCKDYDETKETRVVLTALKKSTSYIIEVVALNQAVKGEAAVFIFKTHDADGNEIPPSKSKPLDSGAIAGIIIAVMLTILVVVDIFCCFFNNCGFTHCCYETFCASKTTKYIPAEGKREEEKELKPASEKLLENAV